jgi:hypothetical protein
MISSLEQEALRLTKAKQDKFQYELANLAKTVYRYLDDNLYESHLKDRAMECVDDVVMISKYASELHGLR